MHINIQDPSITMIRVAINGTTVLEADTAVDGIHFTANNNDSIEIFFEPWAISPIVRFNKHMIHYKAAQIHKYDHMLQFTCNDDYLSPYFAQMTEFKMEHLRSIGNKDMTTTDNIESLIGVNTDCSALINEIKQKIKQ